MPVLREAHALSLALVALLGAGCSVNSATSSINPAAADRAARPPSGSIPSRALIAFDTQNGSLGYWLIKKGGGSTLEPLTGSLGVNGGYSMAANGHTIIVANYSPAEIVTYNLDTQSESTMSDPYGNPLDVAVDRHGNIYAMNSASVTVYKPGSSQPSELTCSSIRFAESIAVNNEGDVFLDGYGSTSNGFLGVVEFRRGSASCTIPHLRATRGYIAGIGVDPKTDDLIVVDDPDLCAGGLEGRMVIYPKPYKERTSSRHVLNANYCAGSFRLDASSTHIFYSDATVSDGFPLIEEARYPSGKFEATYQNGYYSGGGFGGFITIPNRLPN